MSTTGRVEAVFHGRQTSDSSLENDATVELTQQQSSKTPVTISRRILHLFVDYTWFVLALISLIFLNLYINVRDKHDKLPTLIKGENGRTYLFVNRKRSFSNAAKDCQKFGMKLVRIDSEKENNFLWQIAKKKKMTGQGVQRKNEPWIGLEGVRNIWHWKGSCGVNYTNWKVNQPDNMYGVYRKKKREKKRISGRACAYMHSVEGKWDDFPCYTSRPYICEQYSAQEYFLDKCKENKWPYDTFRYDDHEYRIITKKMTFYEAAAHCRKIGMFLTRIDNDFENDFLWKRFQSLSKHSYTKHSYGPWIGLHEDNGKENQWKWDGSCGVYYTNFANNEPNNAGKSEDCVHFYKTGQGHWNDLNCNTKLPFICEKYSPKIYSKSCRKFAENLIEYNGHHYQFISFKRTFLYAKSDCESRGMHLVRIDNKYENEFLWRTALSSPTFDWRRGSLGPWIGLHENATEGKWIWEKYCGSYTNWAPEEPNNRGSEDCAHFHRLHLGTWNDINCDTVLPYICEKYRAENYVSNICSSGNMPYCNTKIIISAFISLIIFNVIIT